MKQRERAIEAGTMIFHALNALPFPIFINDSKLNYLYCNDSFCQLVKLPRSKIIGRNVSQVLKSKFSNKYILQDRILLKKGGTQVSEFDFKDSEGNSRLLSIHKYRFRISEKDEEIGIIGVAADLSTTGRVKDDSEGKNQEQSLEKRYQELERFTRLAVGRELRMMELKNRITELEEKLAKRGDGK